MSRIIDIPSGCGAGDWWWLYATGGILNQHVINPSVAVVGATGIALQTGSIVVSATRWAGIAWGTSEKRRVRRVRRRYFSARA